MWVTALKLGSGRRQTEGSEQQWQRRRRRREEGGAATPMPAAAGRSVHVCGGAVDLPGTPAGRHRPTLLKGRWHSPPAPPARLLLPGQWPQVQGMADGTPPVLLHARPASGAPHLGGRPPAALPYRSTRSGKFMRLC